MGPDEYADVWLACVDRVLITTNIGTRVNVRVYRREPRVLLRGDSDDALKQAKAEIADAFRPFIGRPPTGIRDRSRFWSRFLGLSALRPGGKLRLFRTLLHLLRPERLPECVGLRKGRRWAFWHGLDAASLEGTPRLQPSTSRPVRGWASLSLMA